MAQVWQLPQPPSASMHRSKASPLETTLHVAAEQAGDIFPSMSNFKRGHRATSIGTQLLSNYRKYLAAYERAWATADLPLHPLPPVSACFARH